MRRVGALIAVCLLSLLTLRAGGEESSSIPLAPLVWDAVDAPDSDEAAAIVSAVGPDPTSSAPVT